MFDKSSEKWRLYAGIIVFCQLTRVPSFVLLTPSTQVLDVYFIVVSSVILAQFAAVELLGYRVISNQTSSSIWKFLVLCLLALLSFIYIEHGLQIVMLCAIMCASILLLGFMLGAIRLNCGAASILKFEAFYNLSLNSSSISVLFIFLNSDHLSHTLLLANVTVNFVAAFFGGIYTNKFRSKNQESVRKIEGEPENTNIYLVTAFMLVTQVERLLIGSIYPSVLVAIVIAGTVMQILRRMILDDAIIYKELSSLCFNRRVEYMLATLNTLRRWYFLFALVPLAILLADGSSFIAMLLPSLEVEIIELSLWISLIYMIVAALSQLVINLIRVNNGKLSPNNLYILGTLLVLNVLFFIYMSANVHLFALILISLNTLGYFAVYFVVLHQVKRLNFVNVRFEAFCIILLFNVVWVSNLS